MSQRTIVEFNHDFGYRIKEDPEEFLRLVTLMINGGSRAREVEDGLTDFGVTVTPTHHHSEEATVTIGVYFMKKF
ncbi:hypothetical protein [Roseibium sp. Sym1]|uniref:hypothetical protein n=1 Tax=Roseibium sp. Sym1 TaxID=3016006 RepID=UPI0022B4D49A|nr:hypothetical protein [Roseibium sp. Sym1]